MKESKQTNETTKNLPSEMKGVPQCKSPGGSIDDDALSWSRNNTHLIMNENSESFLTRFNNRKWVEETESKWQEWL